jgi:nucleoside-diphosphate-sugar epimerase
MTNANELHVVIGATGGIGHAVVRELARQGKRVRAVNRKGQGDFPAGVEVMKGDVMDAASAREISKGASVVYNCANVFYGEWLEKFPRIVEGSIEGAASANAKLIFADNLYMYGKAPNGLMTETTPNNPQGKKGALRVQLADTLLTAHKNGKARVAIGRAGDFYGPYANSATTALVLENVLSGKKAQWLGNPDAPHSLTFVDDFARGLTILAEDDRALGEIWHIPSGNPITGREFIKAVYDELGQPMQIGTMNRLMMLVASPFMPIARESLEVIYQFEAPFIMDTSKFKRVLGDMPTTPLREGVRQTIAWMKAHPQAGH